VGVSDEQLNKRGDKAKKAEDQRRRRSHNKTSGKSADWTECDGDVLRKAIAAIAKMGGAVRLGYTRDGGAYAVGIYGDGDPFTEYIPPSDDITEFMKGLIEDYE
jgi:hypothetical protein